MSFTMELSTGLVYCLRQWNSIFILKGIVLKLNETIKTKNKMIVMTSRQMSLTISLLSGYNFTKECSVRKETGDGYRGFHFPVCMIMLGLPRRCPTSNVISGTFPVRAEGLGARGQVFHKYYSYWTCNAS